MGELELLVERDGAWYVRDPETGREWPAMRGGQDLPDPTMTLVYNDQPLTVDAVLNVGGVDSIVPSSDLPGQLEGGVPFGDPNAPGNQSLADIIRSGGSAPTAETVNAGSLSDVLRSGASSPTFDTSIFNPNVPVADQAGSVTVMDAVETFLKGAGAAIGAGVKLLGGSSSTKGGTSNPGTATSTAGIMPLSQRLFGITPGPSGGIPSSVFLASIVLILAAFLFMGRRGAA